MSAYSSLSLNYTETAGSSSSTSTPYLVESYNTIYVSASTYKVNITETSAGSTETTTVWVLKDGTLLAADVSGYNITGSEAQEFSAGIFAGFVVQIEADQDLGLNTYSAYFHSTGTSTVTIGTTQMKVTTYAANTLPETTDECGVSSTITAFSLEAGTPPGASAPLVVYEHIAGSSDGESYDVTVQVTNFTLAS